MINNIKLGDLVQSKTAEGLIKGIVTGLNVKLVDIEGIETGSIIKLIRRV